MVSAPGVESVLRDSVSLSSLELDTKYSHLVKIVEFVDVEICVTVMLDIPEREIRMNVKPGETFEHISAIILNKVGKALKMFYNKTGVSDSQTNGSLRHDCLDLVAFNPEDQDKIEYYILDGHVTESESSEDEDPGDIMDCLTYDKFVIFFHH